MTHVRTVFGVVNTVCRRRKLLRFIFCNLSKTDKKLEILIGSVQRKIILMLKLIRLIKFQVFEIAMLVIKNRVPLTF